MKRSRRNYALPLAVTAILSLTGLTLHPGGNVSTGLSGNSCLPVNQDSAGRRLDFHSLNIALVSHITHAITRKISERTGMVYYLKSRNPFYQPAIFRPFVRIIDPVRQEIIKSVWIGGWPMGLAFTPDGKLAYIPNYDLRTR